MSTWINPYLQFAGSAREAMTRYQEIFGGELDLATFGEFGAAESEEQKDLIMHGHLETEDGWTFMGADGAMADPTSATNTFNVAIGGNAEDVAKVSSWFSELSEGGEVLVPVEKQIWGSLFGMVRDRFGVTWMINLDAAPKEG